MKLPDQKSFLFSVILAVLGFVVVKFALASLALDPALLFGAGLLIGALVIAALSSASSEEAEVKTKTLYVGNLPYRANEGVVRALFEEQGKVFNVRLLKDKNTGKRRGFGFVEMAEADADKAINQLNDSEFQQRTLKVREAKQKQENEANSFREGSDQSA
ncbi:MULTISPECIES: RNA-binding protein [Pseudoalteromonas]|jgi:RNA recognition motif-containing protein|uniref:RNA-binding protein n=2 Tax=Pseudoalteromonas TaxID=53246 RepID=A0ABU8SZR0_9GAMM|nr:MULTISPECIES: RNA-binding protein [Pseudoalteromonas]MAH27117.1 RNA-binding protein [Pseudoalteromonadaceae bacterium]MDC3192063.1 RNA-binding protein [Pseudoalteromonas elyakovii]KPM74674.1 RNA-binding protein [Pseudoalteromonas sp. UCD-33C]KPV96249.1 RNA recognition motif (aka RRM, RBD, or RNP domain) [Pseudoalteromonas sp. P1-8]KPZ67313.1 RNA recognition motif (aka RRM, RBD, or RNP domain) [Pseudoalteromonas sp. P1-26]|tara:strand:- start:639 stop:1118 length:480 start_codon:yes stop_codon:yes gene_type:complete